MRDESPPTEVPAKELDCKPSRRQIPPPGAAAIIPVEFDETTLEKLREHLKPSRRPPIAAPEYMDVKTAIRLYELADDGMDPLDAALLECANIAGTFNRRIAQGFNDRPTPREELQADLAKVRDIAADRIADLSVLPFESERVIGSQSEVEDRLIRAGWNGGDISEDPVSLLRAVDVAIETLANESDARGRRPQWAARVVAWSLAAVWWWATGRSISTWKDREGVRHRPFEAFVAEVIAAAHRAEGRDPEEMSVPYFEKWLSSRPR